MPDSVWARLVDAAKKYVPRDPGQALGEKIRHMYEESEKAKAAQALKDNQARLAEEARPPWPFRILRTCV